MPIHPTREEPSLKERLTDLVEHYGLRRVAEELVEVCWDKGQFTGPWRRIAIRLGNTVHFKVKSDEWPS